MQKARRHGLMTAPTACKRTGSGTISLLCSRCFSPFLHSTRSLSVSGEYLALPDGPGRFTQNSSCSALLRILLPIKSLLVRAFHPLWNDFPDNFQFRFFSDIAVLLPLLTPKRRRFGLFRFRSPLLAESHFVFSSLRY